MNLRDKTQELIDAASSLAATPEQMKALIEAVKSDSQLNNVGEVLPVLQNALRIALSSDNRSNPEQRFEVIKVIADAEAGYHGGEYFRTMLIQAVCGNNPAYIIRRIIELGVDVNAVDCEKRTARDYAMSNNNDEIRKILDEAIKKGK